MKRREGEGERAMPVSPVRSPRQKTPPTSKERLEFPLALLGLLLKKTIGTVREREDICVA